MADQSTTFDARGDEAELFRSYNPQLVRMVTAQGAGPDVAEDACSFAWAQFMTHQPDRDRNWQGWMFKTAQREAWKLSRQQLLQHEHLSLGEDDEGLELPGGPEPHDELVTQERVREGLSIVNELPPRLRRMAMM